jgi:hypothetical protein
MALPAWVLRELARLELSYGAIDLVVKDRKVTALRIHKTTVIPAPGRV